MKSKWSLIGAILMIASLVITQIPTEADAAGSSGSAFRIDGDCLISYEGYESDVTIPNTVTEIASGAFQNNLYVENIRIPKNVKKIGAYAFWGCSNLRTISGGEGLYEIGDFVAANCSSLQEWEIPSNVERIGIMAFGDDISLKSMSIPYTVNEIHDTAFDGCSKLVLEVYPGSEGDRFAKVFEERKKEMPEYEDVEDYQISHTPEVEDVFPSTTISPEPEPTKPTSAEEDTDSKVLGVTRIVANTAVVFMDNTQPTVYTGVPEIENPVEEEVPNFDGYSTEDPDAEEGEYTKATGVPKYAIVDGKMVADHAYYKNASLDVFQIPDGVQEIGEFSFARSSVTEVVIPQGTKTIAFGAFYHCNSLEQIEIPSSVTQIEPKAFEYTPWLQNFFDTSANDFLVVGDGILLAYKGQEAVVAIPEEVKTIAPYVFEKHQEIEKVIFHNGVKRIGEGAMKGCTSLKEVEGLNGVTQIDDLAFAQCNQLSMELPVSLKTIGLGAFYVDGICTESIRMLSAPEIVGGKTMERLSYEEFRKAPFEGRTLVWDAAGEKVSSNYLRLPQNLGSGIQIAEEKQLDCSLKGLEHAYSLQVNENAVDDGSFQRAFERIYGQLEPEKITYLEMTLTDLQSGTEIHRLGKQGMDVILDLPDEFRWRDFNIYTMDRNGQLEAISYVKEEGRLQCHVSHLSYLVLCDFGDLYPMTEGKIVGENHITGFGSKDDSPDTGDPFPVKWILALGVFLVGLSLVLFQKRKYI